MMRGGFGGGGGFGNMQQMMQQAQRMQQQMQREKEKIEQQVFSAKAGGGMVEVEMQGNFKVKRISFKPEAVDPDDTEMLEDLITAAMNDVCAQILKAREALTGGVL